MVRGRAETLDAKGRRTSVTTEKFQLLGTNGWEPQWEGQLAEVGFGSVQFLHLPLPTLLEAKKALAANKATFEDHVVLAVHFEQIQQWAEVMDHWQKAEQTAGAKPGLRWVKSALLGISRQREELKVRIMAEAAGVLVVPDRIVSPSEMSGRLFLAEHLVGLAGSCFEANEMLALLDVLKPLVDKAPAHVPAMRNWLERRAAYLQATGQWDKSLAVRRDLAGRYPHDVNVQAQYARSLADDRDYEAAYAWIAKVVVPAAEWLPNEEESLRNITTDLMRRQGRYANLADYLAAWMKTNPESQAPTSSIRGRSCTATGSTRPTSWPPAGWPRGNRRRSSPRAPPPGSGPR